MIRFWGQNLKSNEDKTIDNNFTPLHTTILPVTRTNPYLDLILKEVIYVIKTHKEIESKKKNIITKMLNSVIYGNHDYEYMNKELHRIWLFMRCLMDLIVNKSEIIGYMINEICEDKIKENSRLSNAWRSYSLLALLWSLQPCVKLFNPQSVQVTFLTEPCYELRKKSIYDLENIITKFVLNKEEKYTLNDLHPVYIDGIGEFLEIYTYPLQHVLVDIVEKYWTYKLPKLINQKTDILKVTPEIAKFTKKVLQFYKNFYKKINKEFENFERNNISEKNNIVPFIYYYLSTTIIKSLSWMIIHIYTQLFGNCGEFRNWHTFAKFFIYPLYKVYDNFCKKLIIDNNDNKFKLYKYFSNRKNKRIIELIWYCGEIG